jgi:hypothetical protein
MLTTWPNCCSRIAGSSPIVSRTGPKKFTAIIRSKSWKRSWLSSRERRIDRPALLTR